MSQLLNSAWLQTKDALLTGLYGDCRYDMDSALEVMRERSIRLIAEQEKKDEEALKDAEKKGLFDRLKELAGNSTVQSEDMFKLQRQNKITMPVLRRVLPMLHAYNSDYSKLERERIHDLCEFIIHQEESFDYPDGYFNRPLDLEAEVLAVVAIQTVIKSIIEHSPNIKAVEKTDDTKFVTKRFHNVIDDMGEIKRLQEALGRVRSDVGFEFEWPDFNLDEKFRAGKWVDVILFANGEHAAADLSLLRLS